jgi:hypothetical protein
MNMAEKSDKVARFIDKKILPSGFLSSFLLFISGVIIFYVFVNDKNTSGIPAIVIMIFCYFLLGIGVYGLFSWLGGKIIQLIGFIFRFILHGNLQIVIDKKGIKVIPFFK